jgi:2,6-dioxo-6-phenylhexa-3-enoate hydrolase
VVTSFASQYVEAGGLKMHYVEGGAGPPLVLLHGGGPAASGRAHYARNLEPLSSTFRVIAPDLPNFGQSDSVSVTAPPSEVNARAVDSLMERLGLADASIVGYSMGGSTAIKLAADYPRRVKRLILLGGGGASLPTLFGPSPTEGNRALTAFAQNSTRENFERAYRLFLFNPQRLDGALLDELWAAYQARASMPQPPAPSTPPPRDNLLPDLPRIQAETLVIRGRDDRYAPLDQGLAVLWSIPRSRLHVFSQCGHWVQYEWPREFHALLRSFLLDETPDRLS